MSGSKMLASLDLMSSVDVSGGGFIDDIYLADAFMHLNNEPIQENMDAIDKAVKTDAEIKQYTVEDDSSIVPILRNYLETAYDVQLLAISSRLVEILREGGEEALLLLFPRLGELLTGAKHYLLLEFGNAFLNYVSGEKPVKKTVYDKHDAWGKGWQTSVEKDIAKEAPQRGVDNTGVSPISYGREIVESDSQNGFVGNKNGGSEGSDGEDGSDEEKQEMLTEEQKQSQNAVRQELFMFLLPLAHQVLQSSDDGPILEKWLELLEKIVVEQPKDSLIDQLLPLALDKGASYETMTSRTVSVRIMHALSLNCEAKTLKARILQTALDLCQDTEHGIRAIMSSCLPQFIKVLGENESEGVLKELDQLLDDEESLVRRAALGALVDLLPIFEVEKRLEFALPYIETGLLPPQAGEDEDGEEDSSIMTRKEDLSPKQEDARDVLLDRFGEVMLYMGNDLDKATLLRFVDFYTACAMSKRTQFRRLCAYSFPAVVKIVDPELYGKYLSRAHSAFAHDKDESVRVSIAASFHEVGQLLGKKLTCSYLPSLLLDLLVDESMDVIDRLIKNLAEIFDFFKGIDEDVQKQTFGAILPLLVKIEGRIAANDWRRKYDLFSQLHDVGHYIDSERIYNQLFPVLLRCLSKEVFPVKKLLIPIVGSIIRNNRYIKQRQDMIQKLIRDLGKSKLHYQRLIFVHTCDHIFKRFSRAFCRRYFFTPLLDLVKDPVANVRIRAIPLLPSLKSQLTLPNDAPQLERLNQIAASLMIDESPAVQAAMHSISHRLSRVLVRVNPNAKGRGHIDSSDRDDRAKLMEEMKMVKQEEVANAEMRRAHSSVVLQPLSHSVARKAAIDSTKPKTNSRWRSGGGSSGSSPAERKGRIGISSHPSRSTGQLRSLRRSKSKPKTNGDGPSPYNSTPNQPKEYASPKPPGLPGSNSRSKLGNSKSSTGKLNGGKNSPNLKPSTSFGAIDSRGDLRSPRGPPAYLRGTASSKLRKSDVPPNNYEKVDKG